MCVYLRQCVCRIEYITSCPSVCMCVCIRAFVCVREHITLCSSVCVRVHAQEIVHVPHFVFVGVCLFV